MVEWCHLFSREPRVVLCFASRSLSTAPERAEVARPAMRDAAPFASLSESVPASAPASPSPSRRPPGDAGFETQRVRTSLLLGDINAVLRGDGDRVPGDGSPADAAGDTVGRAGDARRGSGDGTGDGPRSRGEGATREERFERRVDRVLSLVDALDARLAALAGSGSEETRGDAFERAEGVRGHLDRLLRSPWSEGTQKIPRVKTST